MSDGDLQISITADASGVGQGTEQAKSAITGLSSTLSGVQSTFSGFGAAVAKAFVAPSVSGLTGAIGQVRTSCTELSGSMGQAGQSIRDWAQGADQIKSTLGGVQPSIQGLSKAFDGVSGKVKDAFGGVGAALKGLSAAGEAGASGLAGLAEAAGGVVTAIAAVAGIALSAASAMGQWAERTKDSSDASAAARQNAAALSSGMSAAGSAFGQIGDTIANAFAPVMTTVVADLTSMAQAFEASYDSGGLAKTALDLLVAGANQLVGAISALVDGWKLEGDAASGLGEAGSNALTLLTRLAQGLRDTLANILSPAFEAVRQAASAAWSGVQSGFDKLLGGLKTGYEAWRQFNQPLVAAVKGIGTAFDYVESRASQSFGKIVDWLGKLTQGVVRFLASLPGVSAAFTTLQNGLSGTLRDLQADLGHVKGDLSTVLGMTSPTPASGPSAASRPPPAPKDTPAASASTGSTLAGASKSCDCEPAATSPATQSPDVQTKAVQQSVDGRASLTDYLNGLIKASNASVDGAFVVGQTQQQAVSKQTEQAKADASDSATHRIVDNDRKLVETLKSSVDSMVSTFSKGMLDMAERTKSFSQVMRSMGQQLLNDMLKVIDDIVDKWAWGETERVLASTQGQAVLQALGLKDLAAQILIEAKKTQAVVSGATAQTAAKTSAAAAGNGPQIVSALQALKADAAQVFGNVFAWMTSNPVTAPAAPATAAAASAAVMAVPFALGTNFVPADTLAYVHQGERILPKADNTALMSALGALHGVTDIAPATYRPPGQALGASPSGAGGPWSETGGAGGVHHNTLVYSPQVTPQKDFRKDLQDHASDVFALLQRGIRDGVLKV